MPKVKRDDSTFLSRMRAESKHLTGLDKTLFDGLLEEYDALANMTESLRHAIEEHGVMIEKEVGTVNNRHLERVENPEFTTYQKAIGRLGDLAKKLSDFAKRSDGDIREESDDVANFIRNRHQSLR